MNPARKYTSNGISPLQMKKQKRMVASSGLEPDDEYIDFRLLSRRQFKARA
jgi:hypothetical protein